MHSLRERLARNRNAKFEAARSVASAYSNKVKDKPRNATGGVEADISLMRLAAKKARLTHALASLKNARAVVRACGAQIRISGLDGAGGVRWVVSREGGRERGRERGREGEREGGRVGGRERKERGREWIRRFDSFGLCSA